MKSAQKPWPGATVAILGTGPSLCGSDVALVRGRARVIAINDAMDLAPWAEILYSSDQMWWSRPKGATFTGAKFGIAPRKNRDHRFPLHPDVHVLRNTGPFGLETDPSGLRHGHNSGFAAINLAVHLGAARILLLGYNMGPVDRRLHFNGARGNGANFGRFARAYDTIVAPLKALGVSVLNCTPRSHLRCFPTADLRDALGSAQAAA
jgi:hypothetical protein